MTSGKIAMGFLGAAGKPTAATLGISIYTCLIMRFSTSGREFASCQHSKGSQAV